MKVKGEENSNEEEEMERAKSHGKQNRKSPLVLETKSAKKT